MDLIKVLKEYRDKCYVSSTLCQMSSDYYSRYKHFMSIPLIVSSSVMTILNASNFDTDQMKYANVVLNTCTALILAMSNNFKIPEKCGAFRSCALKFNKLCHQIEDKIIYNESIDKDDIREMVLAYDGIYEGLDYSFPEKVKKKCISMYKNVRVLPNILNCEGEISKNISIDVSKTEKQEGNVEGSIVYNRPRLPGVLETREIVLDDKNAIA